MSSSTQSEEKRERNRADKDEMWVARMQKERADGEKRARERVKGEDRRDAEGNSNPTMCIASSKRRLGARAYDRKGSQESIISDGQRRPDSKDLTVSRRLIEAVAQRGNAYLLTERLYCAVGEHFRSPSSLPRSCALGMSSRLQSHSCGVRDECGWGALRCRRVH